MTAMRMLMALLLLVEAGTGFGAASASAEPASSQTIRLDVSVEAPTDDGPVVAHLFLPGEDEVVQAMAERSPGRWGAVVELRAADWTVVFEATAAGVLSEPLTLTELGVDPVTVGGGPGSADGRDEGPGAETSGPAGPVAAIVAVFLVVVVVGSVWVLTPRRSDPRSRRSAPS